MMLVNGRTVVQCQADAVVYCHVELRRHDVLVAEGVPAESYLPNDDRESFENAGVVVRLHAGFQLAVRDAATVWDTAGCAPLVIVGSQIDAVRQHLARRIFMLRRARAV